MRNDLRLWLRHIGLEQHAEILAANEIDPDLLPELSDQDLKELGLSLGHRRRLQRAIAEKAKGSTQAVAENISGSNVTDTEEVTGRDAQRRQLTILFCDVVGSTELSRRYDPEDLREAMGRYQDLLTAVVQRHGGCVANYSGDGILAYFCWPRADEDEAAQAIRAGLTAVTAVEELSLKVQIGIASGTVVIGGVEAAGRCQIGAVAGDAPNLAARLQTVAKPNTVVICGLTRHLAGATFLLEELGPQMLRGIEGRVPAWRVVGEQPAESRFEARRGRSTPFIGREQELALLIERFERAASGEGQAILLCGEAGIGKSRLLQALHESLSSTRIRPRGYARSARHFMPAARYTLSSGTSNLPTVPEEGWEGSPLKMGTRPRHCSPPCSRCR